MMVAGEDMMEALGIFGVILVLIALVVGVMLFIAPLIIWSNTGKTAKHLEELVRYQRIDRGLDSKTGKVPKAITKG